MGLYSVLDGWMSALRNREEIRHKKTDISVGYWVERGKVHLIVGSILNMNFMFSLEVSKAKGLKDKDGAGKAVEGVLVLGKHYRVEVSSV